MKKRNGRKIIACALAFVLMIGVLPTQAFAATDSELKEIPSVETAEQSVDNVEEVSDGNNGLDPVQNDSETDSENKSIGNFEFYIATSSQSVKLASIKDNGKNTIYIPVSLMSKTAILDFTIKSDSTEQFSVAYSEFDIDGNEKETLTLKESNAGTVSINGSYREQYSFFRYISANNLKWTKTIELSYNRRNHLIQRFGQFVGILSAGLCEIGLSASATLYQLSSIPNNRRSILPIGNQVIAQHNRQ